MKIVLPRTVVAAGLALVCGARPLPGATPAGEGRDRYTVEPATSEIRVDGVLDEEAWAAAAVIPLTHEWFPGDNVAPPVETECLVTFDRENLYVAFRARDPSPGKIRARLADRDTPFDDDTVGFFIDTFNDRRRAFEFRVNALGVQLDAVYSDVDGLEDFSWDAIWDSRGRVTPAGYEAEIAVPWKQLRFPRSAGAQTWGFLATRAYPRSVLHELRSTHNDRGLNCLVCQFETVTGFQALETGHNLEVVPTVTGRRTDERAEPAGPLAQGDEEAEAGLSVRWGVTPNVALNATVNPDFSQVEADAAQLDVNERFALFFPEKRPFFLEGADYFATPLQVVFTRSVADPSAGAKLTGKEGRSAFGLFVAEDRINNLILPGRESSDLAFLDQDVLSGVLRYRRDVGATSTLGVLYAGREGDGYSNQVYGIDGHLRLSDSDTLRFQLVDSETDYPGELVLDQDLPTDSFGGLAWLLDYTRSTRNWFLNVLAQSSEPGFRADSGFVPQVDNRISQVIGQRIFWGEPGGWYSRFTIQTDATLIETHGGDTLEQGANLVFIWEGLRQSSITLGLRPNRESFQGVFFNDFRSDLLASIRPNGNLLLSLFVRGGEIIDFVNVRQSDFLHVQPRVEYRFGRRVSGELDYTWQSFETEGAEFLEAHLAQTTLRYHFNLETFVRLILQYRDVTRDLALYDPGVDLAAEEEELFTQLLFSYKLNPQTVLLAGYSDFHEGTPETSLAQRSRTFFLKIGYAWLW